MKNANVLDEKPISQLCSCGEARLELTLVCYKPVCFLHINDRELKPVSTTESNAVLHTKKSKCCI